MIQELLASHLLEEDKKKADRVRSGLWNPSSFMQCYRRQVWNRRNIEPSDKPGIDKLKIFYAGNCFHQMIQKLLPEHQCEVEVTTDLIHGFADIVLADEVIDIKSQNSFSFKLMNKKEFDISKDKVDHVVQVCTYAWILNKPNARMVYINKDTLEIKEFPLVVKDFIPKIEEELAKLNEWWAKGEDPPASPRLYGGKECVYCQFLTKCKNKPF